MNEYMTQRWKAPSAQLQLSASENGKPHDVRVTGSGFTARDHLVEIRGSELARSFVSCANSRSGKCLVALVQSQGKTRNIPSHSDP